MGWFGRGTLALTLQLWWHRSTNLTLQINVSPPQCNCHIGSMGPCQGGATIMQLAIVQLDITLPLCICYCAMCIRANKNCKSSSTGSCSPSKVFFMKHILQNCVVILHILQHSVFRCLTLFFTMNKEKVHIIFVYIIELFN